MLTFSKFLRDMMHSCVSLWNSCKKLNKESFSPPPQIMHYGEFTPLSYRPNHMITELYVKYNIFFTDCQRRFRGLRDTYMKEKKRLNTRPSGSSGKNKKVWAYYSIMESLLGQYQATVQYVYSSVCSLINNY